MYKVLLESMAWCFSSVWRNSWLLFLEKFVSAYFLLFLSQDSVAHISNLVSCSLCLPYSFPWFPYFLFLMCQLGVFYYLSFWLWSLLFVVFYYLSFWLLLLLLCMCVCVISSLQLSKINLICLFSVLQFEINCAYRYWLSDEIFIGFIKSPIYVLIVFCYLH